MKECWKVLIPTNITKFCFLTHWSGQELFSTLLCTHSLEIVALTKYQAFMFFPIYISRFYILPRTYSLIFFNFLQWKQHGREKYKLMSCNGCVHCSRCWNLFEFSNWDNSSYPVSWYCNLGSVHCQKVNTVELTVLFEENIDRTHEQTLNKYENLYHQVGVDRQVKIECYGLVINST